jgi:hypothetical protein
MRASKWYGKRVYNASSNEIFVSGNTLNYSSFTEENFYLTKFSSSGSILWSIDNIPNGHSAVNNDYIFITALEGGQQHIKRLALDGTLIWDVSTGLSSQIKDIKVDVTGSVYIVGALYLEQAIIGEDTLRNSTENQYFFLAKMDCSGNWLWARQSTDGHIFQHLNINVSDNHNVYVSGEFFENLESNSDVISSAGGSNGFIAKYNDQGVYDWSFNVGSYGPSGGQEWVNSVDEDSKGNVYAVGYYDNTLQIGSTLLPDVTGYESAFILKLDKDGLPLWADGMYGAWKKTAEYVKVDNNDQVYVTGAFGDPVTFGSITMTNPGYLEPYLVKYDSTGTSLWATAFGGGGSGCGIDITPDNKILVSGIFGESVDFGGHPQTAVGNSMFLTKISDNSATTTSVSNPEKTFSALSVSPNPGNGIFHISYSAAITEDLILSVFDAKSQIVYSEKIAASGSIEKVIDLSGKAKGVYTIEIKGKKIREVSRIVFH